MNPDQQVQGAVRRLFEVFRETGSALAVVKRFRREQWLFPRRVRGGTNRGDLLWGALGHTSVLNVLHNPRYAGAYVFGRTRVHRSKNGKSGSGQPFTPSRVRMLCWMYSLRSRRERLKAAGYRTAAELAKELGVSTATVKIWRRRGLLQAIAGTDRGDWYFKPLGADRPKKQQGCKLSERIQTVPVKSSKRGAP